MASYRREVDSKRLLEELQGPDPEKALKAARKLRDVQQEGEQSAVLAARAAGMSWQQIAELLGRAKSAVWERYSD